VWRGNQQERLRTDLKFTLSPTKSAGI
jgi:hypothetical protein